MDELLKERFELAAGRIAEIAVEPCVQEPFGGYFQKTAAFLQEMLNLYHEISQGRYREYSLDVLRQKNCDMYRDILPENYDTSYGNPAWAAEKLGKDFGQMLSFLYTELRGLIVYAFEDRVWDMLVGVELFLQVYGEFEDGDMPAAENIRKILYWYVNDYCQEMVEERVAAGIDPARDFAVRLIMESDLSDLRYLYQFGEYVTDQEEKTAAFLNTLPIAEVKAMARTYTEGYRIGFEVAGKDISKKKTVNIRYCLGFERMVREAVLQFEQMGLQPVIYRAATHAVNKRQHIRVGYYGAIPNPQYDYDHRNDSALFLDEEFVSRKLRALRGAYEKYKELAAWHGGPAVIEIFGMVPFVPETCRDSVTMTEKQQKLQVHLNNESGQITNRYIRGDERSFTIIAYPVPAIGEQFEEIFRETVKINTLDYNLYREIQQKLIDALDQGTSVHIVGNNGNHTDLRVQLHKLQNPEKETNFENCVADVNIPVGEVFTSPVLEGTNGVLHVTSVYLEELQYQNLELKFENGRITEYSCTNFPEEAENKAYISENILHHHPSLPLGEFAIGTNTTAYRMAKDYGIEDKLPILITEKMGPHFAVGDTCYSWSEDTPVYNPDGKEIIARDNEQSLMRKTDPGKAYLGCHTDITIPYDELGLIVVEREDGGTLELIRDGKFVLAGTEILNKAL